MHKFTSVAEAAVTAGLSLSVLAGNVTPAFADARLPRADYGAEFAYGTTDTETHGQTRIYVKGNPVTDLKDEATVGQYQVTIPVGIHFVATTDGTIVGPSDGTAIFENKSSHYDVHISKIGVQADGGATLKADPSGLNSDEIYISMTPTRGKLVEGKFVANNNQTAEVDKLANYLEPKAPALGENYDIEKDGGILALNKLGGKIGGFNKLNPATDTQVGTVNWVVRAGSRHEADLEDCICTIRFHANGGTWLNGALPDQRVEVFDSSKLPTQKVNEEACKTLLPNGQEYLAKYVVNADGTFETKQFKGWYLVPHGDDDSLDGASQVSKVGDLSSTGQYAGKTFDVYAAYGA